MKICFTSYRPFPDGPAQQPFQESDPANIAYVLAGDYFSFYTLKALTFNQLREKLRPYDLVLVALDIQAIDLVLRIVEACKDRAVTYSEGHISDYQQLSPSGQIAFLQALRACRINFVYWEKYVPFFRVLTPTPVEYLPYPYLLHLGQSHQRPLSQRALTVAIPSGLGGYTRNGLASLSAIKKLLAKNVVSEVIGWLEAETFTEDARAIAYFLYETPFVRPPQLPSLNWRTLLLRWRLDYRLLIRLIKMVRKPSTSITNPAFIRFSNCTLYRRHNWQAYLEQLAPARLMIDLNNRETVGRNALDCAALGIVSVSTGRSDMQPRLFPQTTIEDSWNIDAAAETSQRLLSDPAFFQQVASYAQDAVRQFAPENFRSRFSDIIAEIF